MTLTRRDVVWLIPILLTVHNAEEAAAFWRHWRELPLLLPSPFRSIPERFPPEAMLGVLLALSLGAFLLALSVDRQPASRFVLWLLLALEATVGLNALWHVGVAAIVFHGYAPGLVTAITLNAPFAVYCFTRARRERWLTGRALWSTMPAAFVLHGPVFIAALWTASLSSR